MSHVMCLTSPVPLEEIPPPPGLVILLEAGETAYQNAGAGFAVFGEDPIPEVSTRLPLFYGLETYGPGHEEALAAYLRAQAEAVGELEAWSLWLDGSFCHRVRRVDIPAGELTAEDLRELEALEVWRLDPVMEVPVDYCYHIRT